MNLLAFLVCTWAAEKSFVLDYQKPIRMTIRSPRTLLDDILIIADDQSLLFFDLKGRYLGKLGRFGQGPGEFQDIDGFVVNRRGLVGILDLGASTFSLFQWPGGKFIRRFPEKAQAIFPDVPSDKFYFLRLDPKRQDAHLNSNAGLSDYDLPILEEIELEKAERIDPDTRFHLPSEPITRRSFNDRGHWIRTRGNQLLILDEFSPQISIYDAATHELLDVQPLRLPGFVEAPKKTPNIPGMTNDEYRDWWYSFSRFLDMNVGENRVSVTYLVPNPGEASLYKCLVVNLSGDWQIRSKDTELGHYQTDRYYLGSNSRYYAFIGDISEDVFPKYQVILRTLVK